MNPTSDTRGPEALSSLAKASAVINSTLDFETVLDNIATSATKVMCAEAASVLILDKPRRKLVFVAATGNRRDVILGREFDADLGIAGRVAATGKPELVLDVHADDHFFAGIDAVTKFQTRAIIAAPMVVQSEVLGVVEVLNRIGGRFSERDLDLLQVFANLAAVAARNARTHQHLKQAHDELRAQVLKTDRIIGTSKAIGDARALCDRVAPSTATVLLLGETGTGKELFAKYIHNSSNRADKAFVPVHCAALAETLLESELFGHEKGAFTGAVARQRGRFEMADGGTIFLDEIGEISPAIQVKLLRVLSEQSFERVGGGVTIQCDARVIAATNRDLKAEIAAGRFRDDLYYRLNVFPVTLPPLRHRREDIPTLVGHFVARAAGKLRFAAPKTSDGAIAAMTAYDWPGNVRELENVAERAVLLCDGQTIELCDLPVEITGDPSSEGDTENDPTLRGVERAMIVKALEDHGWNQTQAARHLAISRDNLRYRIKKYNIKKGKA